MSPGPGIWSAPLSLYSESSSSTFWINTGRRCNPGVEVRICPSPDGTKETFVLCRSLGRKEKENAILNRFVASLEDKARQTGSTGRTRQTHRQTESGTTDRTASGTDTAVPPRSSRSPSPKKMIVFPLTSKKTKSATSGRSKPEAVTSSAPTGRRLILRPCGIPTFS